MSKKINDAASTDLRIIQIWQMSTAENRATYCYTSNFMRFMKIYKRITQH